MFFDIITERTLKTSGFSGFSRIAVLILLCKQFDKFQFLEQLEIIKGVNDSFTPFVIPLSPQRFTHRGSGFGFAYGVEMAVDVGGGAHIAVTEPFPDLLHSDGFYKKSQKIYGL